MTPPNTSPRTPRRSHRRLLVALSLASAAVLVPLAHAADTTPAEQLARFTKQAGAAGQAERGQAFFTSRHGGEWSCASCHGKPPTGNGRHANTGKTLAPLAPAANPQTFTDSAKVDKWLRRNCRDVAQRECTAGEKADLLAYLIALQP